MAHRPPFFSAPRQFLLAEYALLPLRAFLGGTFLFAGLQKLANPGFLDAQNPASIQAQLLGASTHSPIGSLVAHLGEHATLLGIGIALGEVAIGLGVVLGLWTRLAALGGMALSFGLFLTVSFHASPFYTGSDIVFFFAFIPFLLAGAGTHLSLDAIIARRVAQREHGVDPRVVAAPFAVVQQHCGNFADGACRALSGASCDAAVCPVLERTTPSWRGRRRLTDHERRTVLIGAGFAAAVAGAAAVLSAAAAVLGRVVGGVQTSEVTHLSTTTTTTSSSTTTVPVSTTTMPGTVIGSASDVAVGSFAEFEIPSTGEPGIVIHPHSDEWLAYNAVCSHAGCTVTYLSSSEQIACPCHASIFDLESGDLISGPAYTGLAKLTVVERDGQLILE